MFKSTFEKLGSKIAPLTFATAMLVNSSCETQNTSDKAVTIENPQQSSSSEMAKGFQTLIRIHLLSSSKLPQEQSQALSQEKNIELAAQSILNIESNPDTQKLLNKFPYPVSSSLYDHILDTQEPMTAQDLLDAVQPNGVDSDDLSELIDNIEYLKLSSSLVSSFSSTDANSLDGVQDLLANIARFTEEFYRNYPISRHSVRKGFIRHQLYLQASMKELEGSTIFGILQYYFPDAIAEYIKQYQHDRNANKLDSIQGVPELMHALGLDEIYSKYGNPTLENADDNEAFQIILSLFGQMQNEDSIKTLDELKAYTKRINYYTKGYLNSPYLQQTYSLEKFLIENMQNEMNK